MNLIRYGIITVSAGISIGGALWYTRGNAVSGEDLAECVAAATERELATATGTNDYSFTSNTVQSGVSWYPLYNITLDNTRSSLDLEQDTLNLAWLDSSFATPADGDVIVSNQVVWTLQETDTSFDPHYAIMGTEWGPFMYDMFPTVASRMPSDGVILQPEVHDLSAYAPTNAPLCWNFYNGWPNLTPVMGCPYTNWWPIAGLGTNAYRFACESLQQDTAVTVTASPVSVFGYTLAATGLTFTASDYATPKQLVATETTGSSDNGAAVWSLTSAGLDATLFGVADAWSQVQTGAQDNRYHLYATTTSYGSPEMNIEIPSGTSIVLYLDGGVLSGTAKTAALTYTGGLSGPSGASWSEAVSPFQGSITVGCAVASGGVMTIHHVELNLDTRVVILNPQTTPEIVTDPITQTAVASGTATFDITLAVAPSNTPIAVRLNKGITTNNLNQARSLLSNLNRTIYITDAPNYQYFQWASNYHGEGSASYLTAEDVDTVAEEAFSDAAETSSNDLGWSGLLAKVTLSRCESHAYIQAPYDDQYAQASVAYDCAFIKGIRMDYPAAWAYTNGYIAKVSIFAVVVDNEAEYRISPYNLSSDETLISFTGDATGPAYGGDFGTGYSVSYVADADWPTDTLDLCYKAAGLTGTYDLPQPFMYLTLLFTEENPTAMPVFDLGMRVPPMPTGMQHGYDLIRVPAGGTYPTDRDTTSERSYDHSISISHFVVVVDWNWRHFGATPFVPSNNVPAWATP